MWWLDPEDYKSNPTEKTEEKDLDWDQKYCYHSWKKTTLIISVVEDCTKCGIKKEDWESNDNATRTKP
jgi:hypothetical protein